MPYLFYTEYLFQEQHIFYQSKMKKILLLHALIGIELFYLPAQDITIDWDWINNNTQIEITYDLPESRLGKDFNVTVYVSLNGGINFLDNPLSLVSGDVGTGIKAGPKKKIVWDVFKEIPDFRGTIVFNVKAKAISDKTQQRFYVGYKGSVSAPFGLIAGISGKTGFYISSRINAMGFLKVTKKMNGIIPPPDWKVVQGTEIRNQRFSITAGIRPKIGNNLFLFTGIGFTQYNELWQIRLDAPNGATDWAKQPDDSFSSYELEAGLFYQIKRVFLSAGISWYNVKYADFLFAVGFQF
jgi:hypothetical protein